MIKNILDISHDFEHEGEIILRDHLALERTKLANERTLLSYIRTSLYLLLAGITFLQIQHFDNIRWIGFGFIGLSSFFVVRGYLKYTNLKNRLRKYYFK